MAFNTSQEKTLRMQPLSGVLKNVCAEGFKDTVFSSVTVEVLSYHYGSKAMKEQLIQRTPHNGYLNNFSAGLFIFCSNF